MKPRAHQLTLVALRQWPRNSVKCHVKLHRSQNNLHLRNEDVTEHLSLFFLILFWAMFGTIVNFHALSTNESSRGILIRASSLLGFIYQSLEQHLFGLYVCNTYVFSYKRASAPKNCCFIVIESKENLL